MKEGNDWLVEGGSHIAATTKPSLSPLAIQFGRTSHRQQEKAMIVAAQPGRKAYLPELEPLNCDIIVPRFVRFTGQKARCQNKL